MLTWVRGLLVGLWIGIALTSTLEVETGGSSVMDWRGDSRFTGRAGLMVVSVVVDRWGMFFISLYRDWLDGMIKLYVFSVAGSDYSRWGGWLRVVFSLCDDVDVLAAVSN
jgi:hypothetical protein